MSIKMKDIKPFALRMPPKLREQLERAAVQNKRSLNQEVMERLEASIANTPPSAPRASVYNAEMATGTYRLSELETVLLDLFKHMQVEKQLALLSLFK